MLIIPNIIITILFISCFILNSISICLCLSALFLLILTYLDLGHFLGVGGRETSSSSSSSSNFPDHHHHIVSESPQYSNDNSTTTTTTTTIALFNFNPQSLSNDDHDDDQLNLIFYLLFYLAVAILGVIGATRNSYQTNKLTYLTCHVLLLGSIICYNLIAWFHFRSYSPLNRTSENDPDLLLASLFDFVDFLIGFSLLIALILNSKQQQQQIIIINNNNNSKNIIIEIPLHRSHYHPINQPT
ncbi:uncharacterized protein LOC124499061 [Dermatophagoides farinae]|uniref:uncharacterized protein LOC124499061 n=1 Tax=Dermatophagoides farinae TaxID=6954 RepID=UPI003F63B43E